MEINKIGSVGPVYAPTHVGAAYRTQQTPSARQTSDKVDVSRSNQLFKQALDAAQQTPEVRQNLVDEMQEKIATGQYKIDPQSIARRIISQSGF